jgi:hypothetical protein
MAAAFFLRNFAPKRPNFYMFLIRSILVSFCLTTFASATLAQTPGTFSVKKTDEPEAHPLVGAWCLSIVKVTGAAEQHFDCDSAVTKWTFTEDGFYIIKNDSVTETGVWKFKDRRGKQMLVLQKRRIVKKKGGEITNAQEYQHRVDGLTKDRFILSEWEGDQARFHYYLKE